MSRTTSKRPVGSDDPLAWVRYYWERDLDENPDAFLTMASVMRLHQLSMNVLKSALKPLRLNPRQYLFLMTLLLSEDGARLLSRLSDDLMVHPTTVTVLADQLEERKLVARMPHPSDRRAVYCQLTPAGRELSLRATKILHDLNYGFDDLEESAIAKLLNDLTVVRGAIGDREKRRDRSAGSAVSS
jgi:DNA-binding MarR family transcriptional regulator